jgi:hypothetical protein
MAVRMPVSDTGATAGFDDCQATPPVTTCLLPVVETDAVSRLVCPVGIVAGPTMSSDLTVLATTVMTSVPVATGSLALIIVTPVAIAVTSPLVDTVATPGFDEFQVAVAVTSSVVVADGLSTAFN